MKLALTSSTLILIISFSTLIESPKHAREHGVEGFSPNVDLRVESCSCTDMAALSGRLKGVDAVLAALAAESRRAGASGDFDPAAFDSGLGDRLTEILITNGGMNSLVIANIDRSSCEITTGASLANMPGVPAGLGGSACLTDGATAGLNVRRQACLAGRNSSNEGNDYWEGRQTSAVIRELNDAYTAEANFLKQQIARLAVTCGGGTTKPVPTPPTNICNNCVQYLFEGERTLPVVGTIRMTANEILNFSVAPDHKISGTDTITTALDTSGSPCTFSGYNGVAEINISGELLGGYVNAIITPRGASQRTSAHMKITCPPKGKAEVFPVQQDYELHESLKIPLRGQRYTEKRIDLSQRTLGAMRGYIILRLFMTPQ